MTGNVERETDRWERSTQIEDKALAVFGFENDTQAMIEMSTDICT